MMRRINLQTQIYMHKETNKMQCNIKYTERFLLNQHSFIYTILFLVQPLLSFDSQE